MVEPKRLRVLLLEDSEVQAHIVSTYLGAQGYPVQVVETVQAACRGLSSVDVVVLDIHPSDGSGYDVLDFIRQRQLSLKVLMLSQLGELADRIRGLKAVADDHLPKLTHLTELEACIQSLGRQLHTQNTLKVSGWTIQSDALQVDWEREPCNSPDRNCNCCSNSPKSRKSRQPGGTFSGRVERSGAGGATQHP